jgi:hypothetical protein
LTLDGDRPHCSGNQPGSPRAADAGRTPRTLPDRRAADGMSINVVADGALLRRVIAPANPAATVGATVRDFGHFYASILYLSSSGDVPEDISVADRLVLESGPEA